MKSINSILSKIIGQVVGNTTFTYTQSSEHSYYCGAKPHTYEDCMPIAYLVFSTLKELRKTEFGSIIIRTSEFDNNNAEYRHTAYLTNGKETSKLIKSIHKMYKY